MIPAVAPIIKGNTKWHSPFLGALLEYGTFVDPFVSSIRHSCTPNAWWVLDRTQINVLAFTDIAANEELTIAYTAPAEDTEDRARRLKHHWDIVCNCALCQNGNSNCSVERIRQGWLDIASQHPSNPKSTISGIEWAFETMHSLGFNDHGSPAMRIVASSAIYADLINKQTENALKSTLHMYFLIEPHTIPATAPLTHVNTLFNIIAHTCHKAEELQFPPLSADLFRLMSRLRLPLREILVDATARCFATHSYIANIEKLILAGTIEECEEAARKVGLNVPYQSPKHSENAKESFMKDMNSILAWAGVPDRTYSQLMP